MSKHKFSLALVTGASSGIGESLCHLLAKQGINLIITGRNQENLDNLKKQLSAQVQVTSISVDLSKPESRQLIIDLIHKQAPDLVINNAGFGLYGDALTHETNDQLEILNINGNVVLEITLEAARTLASKDKKGVIINISSAAAFQVIPALAVYSATKTFVNQISEALDYEMKPLGIRVFAACPGMVATEFAKRAARADQFQDNKLSMTADFAAQQIWDQIQREEPIYIFDWRTRMATHLSKILPKCILRKFLRNSIITRLPKNSV